MHIVVVLITSIYFVMRFFSSLFYTKSHHLIHVDANISKMIIIAIESDFLMVSTSMYLYHKNKNLELFKGSFKNTRNVMTMEILLTHVNHSR